MQIWFRTEEGVPLSTAWDARVGRRLTAAAIAAALQGVFYLLILHEAIESPAPTSSKPLEVTLLRATRRLHPTVSAPKHVLRPARWALPRNESRAASGTGAQPITLPQRAKPAAHAPIDWQEAIRGEVRSNESRSGASRFQFGFPRLPAPAPTAPQFGWDYAQTHRLEPLPRGGLLINLSDHCAIVVYGFMFLPGCRIGAIPANGRLFDHMRDGSNDRLRALP